MNDIKSDDFFENNVEVIQDEKDKTRYHFKCTLRQAPLMCNKGDGLAERMQLSIIEKVINKTFTQDEIDTIVNITCNISPWIIMWQALEILDAGLANKYIEDKELRRIIDLWAKTRFAELTLKEFLQNVQNDAV